MQYDLWVGYELLCGHQDKQVIGDKAYINTQIKDQLAQLNRIDLITIPRRNQKQQISRQTKFWWMSHPLNSADQYDNG